MITLVIPSLVEGSRREIFTVTSTGSLGCARDDNHTRERRRWAPPREYLTGLHFGSIFVRPMPLFTP
jgi:hypothetical protein